MSKAESLTFATTIEVRDGCLCLHVQRAARALARRLDEAFRPVGITHGQFSLLMSLNRPQPARMREVSNLLAMDRTTLTANLKPLERRGLVQVSADPADRRSRLLVLTEAGRDLLVSAMPLWRRSQQDVGALLPPGACDRLLADLRALF